jgi:hypothetical protein
MQFFWDGKNRVFSICNKSIEQSSKDLAIFYFIDCSKKTTGFYLPIWKIKYYSCIQYQVLPFLPQSFTMKDKYLSALLFFLPSGQLVRLVISTVFISFSPNLKTIRHANF